MTRQNFPRAVRRAAYERAGGRCEVCTADLTGQRWECDHVIADWLGGRPVLGNARCLCVACHASKTRADRQMIAKAKRQKRAHETGRGRARRGPPMRSRSFTGWRKFNGEVVRA